MPKLISTRLREILSPLKSGGSSQSCGGNQASGVLRIFLSLSLSLSLSLFVVTIFLSNEIHFVCARSTFPPSEATVSSNSLPIDSCRASRRDKNRRRSDHRWSRQEIEPLAASMPVATPIVFPSDRVIQRIGVRSSARLGKRREPVDEIVNERDICTSDVAFTK